MPQQSRFDMIANEFSDVFEPPGMPPPRAVVHTIDLVDESSPPPKPKLYRMSPLELAEVRR